ncbi:hypothetical protein [Caballeronia sp. Lep1P3]|uniref:hypothetical protein n=1 Tax=Caballeronia sp. Lep1P3 TaxID=2878150 RepID=UPI00351CEE9F
MLDKKWSYRSMAESARHDATMFTLYVRMGLVTTDIYWGGLWLRLHLQHGGSPLHCHVHLSCHRLRRLGSARQALRLCALLLERRSLDHEPRHCGYVHDAPSELLGGISC